MKVKKIPMRMCTGCSTMKPKNELIRIVKNNEGVVSLDLVGKKPGRGAYICKSKECFDKAYKSKRLNRNLETQISEDIYKEIRDLIEDEQ